MWARTFHHVKNKLEKAENVGNKAKGWISKRVFLENKARQIFRKTNISYPLKQSLTKISRRKILNENFSHFIVEILRKMCTAWKVSKYGDFLVCVFPYSDCKIYWVNLHIHSEYGKIRTRKISVFGHFSHSLKIKNVVSLQKTSRCFINSMCHSFFEKNSEWNNLNCNVFSRKTWLSQGIVISLNKFFI